MTKYTAILTTSFITLSLFGTLLLHSCKKSGSNCYSAALAAEYKDKGCFTDCPGVTGCDGKFYCNACDAAKLGITVDE